MIVKIESVRNILVLLRVLEVKIILFFYFHILHEFTHFIQIARPLPIGLARVRKTSETNPILRARKFCLLKKSINLQVFSRLGKTMKKLH